MSPVPALDLATIARSLEPSLASTTGSPVGAPSAPAPASGPRAAVAAILREGASGTEVLFIRRAERAGDPWSGHMAFPGGRRDAADPDLHTTAVRETREEVGIDLDAHGTLLGRLADLEAVLRPRPGAHMGGGSAPRSPGLVISPFVFALTHDVTLVFDPEEVAGALWAPLAPLWRDEGAGTVAHEWEGRKFTLPCWYVEGHVVWGLTYRMLRMLFEAVDVGEAAR